jgi:hypothetical protein
LTSGIRETLIRHEKKKSAQVYRTYLARPGRTLPSGQAAENIIAAENDGDKKKKVPWEPYGRTESEKERDSRLLSEQFFTPSELTTIAVLADI